MQPKRLALLAYLALAMPRGFQRRDSLLALFWPDASQDEARNALRQALHHLRQQLGDVIDSRSDDQVALVDDAISCDAVELERAIAANDFARAVELYQGPFLDAVFVRGVAPEFEEWVDRTRTRLRAATAEAARRLAERALGEGQSEDAIVAARRRLDIEPENEAAARALLVLLDDHKGSAEAIVEADRFRQLLRQRYELEPSTETKALVESIRAGTRVKPSLTANPPSTRAVTAAPALTPTAVPSAGFSAGKLKYVAIAVGVLAAAWLGSRLVQSAPPAPSLTQPTVDRVFVTDFVDRTDRTSLGRAVATALRVDLAQSPRLRVLTAAQIGATLRLMAQPVENGIGDSLARVIATREGVKGFVAGDVDAVGSTIVLTARLVSAANGDQLAAAREVARDSTDVIGAIERLSRSLRHRIGENLAQVGEAMPLSRVTTPSLAALQRYSDGLRLIDIGNRADGVARLEQAVAIDSGFATAHRILGASYAALGDPARAAAALERAFANRGRLTYRERHLVMGSYHRNATHEYASAVTAYRALLATDPDDVAALNNLGLTLISLGNNVAAESLFRRVVAADSAQVNARLVLAETIASQGRFADARAVLDETARRFPEHPVVGLTRIYIAAAASDWPNAERFAAERLAVVTATGQRIDALQTLGQIEVLTGRTTNARAHLEESMRLARTDDSPRRYLWAAMTLGWLDLRFQNRPEDARRGLRRALETYPPKSLAAEDVPVAELASLLLALGMARDVRGLLPASPDTVGKPAAAAEWLYVVGVASGAEGRWPDAASALQAAAAQPQECTICMLPDLAFARERAGDVGGAIDAAQRYLDTPYIHRFEPDAAYLRATLEMLGRLYESRADTAKAGTVRRRLQTLSGGPERR